jgi:hypothetical protein
VTDPTLVWIVRAQFAAAGLYAAAWLQYAEDDLGPFPRRLGQGMRAALVLLSLLSFIPGVSASGRIAVHQVPELHLVYRDVLPTTLGTLAMAGMLAGLVLSAIAYGEAAIRGVPHAFGHFAALLAMIIGGANDAIVSYGAAAMPYLLDVGNLAEREGGPCVPASSLLGGRAGACRGKRCRGGCCGHSRNCSRTLTTRE